VASEETGNSSRRAQSDRTIDRLIAELADRQHGVVATWQLVAMGMTHDAIRYLARFGRSIVYTAVYTQWVIGRSRPKATAWRQSPPMVPMPC
jgi:hypothetical protein